MDGFTLYPIYHPAAALHRQSLRKVVEEDFKAILTLLAERPPQLRQEPDAQQLPMF
jgi:DNA polymerase